MQIVASDSAKSYATRERAVKAVDKFVAETTSLIDESFHWVVIPTRQDRFTPVFFLKHGSNGLGYARWIAERGWSVYN